MFTTVEFGKFGKHRFWRLYKTNDIGGAWHQEVQFYETEKLLLPENLRILARNINSSQRYAVERSGDLNEWYSVFSILYGQGLSGDIFDPDALTTQRAFYRILGISDGILVTYPKRIKEQILPAQRRELGIKGDYKPCIALYADGDLILSAFHEYPVGENQIRGEILMFRSQDGGFSWSSRESYDLLGREPYPTVLKDGVLLVTTHLLPQDVRNKDGYVHSYIHRSVDKGRTWMTTRIGPDGFRPRAEVLTSRNVLEMPDGSLILAVAPNGGPESFWRSLDRGKTWQFWKDVDFGSFRSRYSNFNEAFLWLGSSGRILNIVRVGSAEIPIPGKRVFIPDDQSDHMVFFKSDDDGATMLSAGPLGTYGEMYPSILRLKEGALLLTYTVRAQHPRLGVRAILGRETNEGAVFDFSSDGFELDYKTPVGESSGGGFGPTLQLSDGTLVTCYSFRREDEVNIEVVRWRIPDVNP